MESVPQETDAQVFAAANALLLIAEGSPLARGLSYGGQEKLMLTAAALLLVPALVDTLAAEWGQDAGDVYGALRQEFAVAGEQESSGGS